MKLRTTPRAPSLAAAVALVVSLAAPAARAANNEPASCLSSDPSQWPAPAKPYFLFAIDTSAAMATPLPFDAANPTTLGPAPSACPGYPGNRSGHLRCALEQTFQAYAGQASFGAFGFALAQSGCTASCTCVTSPSYACFSSCSYAPASGAADGCGPITGSDAATRRGGNLLVPLQQDHFWSNPPSPSNAAQLLALADGACGDSAELWATGKAPINGALRDATRYLEGTYVNPLTGAAFATPLDPTNERACRSVNVVLVTSADEGCDTFADATAAATKLYGGVKVGDFTWSVRTHVVSLVGGKNAAVIAGTGASSTAPGSSAGHGYYAEATDATSLAQAIGRLVASATKRETCDNADNDCNGCTDEGFPHFADVQPIASSCCSQSRDTCLAAYRSSITAQNPKGDVTLLPCTSLAAAATPSTWLCYDPGERCDDVDNDGDGKIDEGVLKCGNPAHCPRAEVLDGQDDDCDGVIDEGFPGVCNATPEICDGCDNDCDGIVDDGIAAAPCGQSSPTSPPWCLGVRTCTGGASVVPGGCVAGGGKSQCSTAPQTEACNGLDDDCDGLVDDAIPGAPCVPAGTSPTLVYGGASACRTGTTQCTSGQTTCIGFAGPSAEVCDGIDNDCDGTVDDGVPGVGMPCGVDQPPCTPGVTACVNGALVCAGGVQAKPEACNGVDDDCNGMIDDGPLADAPSGAQLGCWDLPGNCCSWTSPRTGATTSWCPPPGAGCQDAGSLVAACTAGTLACRSAGWVCVGARDPGAESCNALDDDCNGQIDDGAIPGVGAACGSDVGACKPGATACADGVIVCNAVGPTWELCNGVDDDCDGVVDNVPQSGASCTPAYDPTAYPGARDEGACRPGVTQCAGGADACVGGVAPQPEVCDGVDNDCDGLVDEPGAAPDGIDGSADPSDGSRAIGSVCGASTGSCKPGVWTCDRGAFACSGGASPSIEVCNGIDDDCDGTIDDPGATPLCGAGTECVRAGTVARCAQPCDAGQTFPCPTGQVCVDATFTTSGGAAGPYCLPASLVGDAGADAMPMRLVPAPGASDPAAAGASCAAAPRPASPSRGAALVLAALGAALARRRRAPRGARAAGEVSR